MVPQVGSTSRTLYGIGIRRHGPAIYEHRHLGIRDRTAVSESEGIWIDHRAHLYLSLPVNGAGRYRLRPAEAAERPMPSKPQHAHCARMRDDVLSTMFGMFPFLLKVSADKRTLVGRRTQWLECPLLGQTCRSSIARRAAGICATSDIARASSTLPAMGEVGRKETVRSGQLERRSGHSRLHTQRLLSTEVV